MNFFYQEAWSNIQPELRQQLVDGYQKGLAKVQLGQGH